MTDLRRRSRPPVRERSRFGKGSGKAGRDLIRFRRNRELMVRELTVMVLWIAVLIMLLDLASTLRAVSNAQLTDRAWPLRLALPLVAIGGAVFCGWRARGNWLEFRDIRAEQREVRSRMEDHSNPED